MGAAQDLGDRMEDISAFCSNRRGGDAQGQGRAVDKGAGQSVFAVVFERMDDARKAVDAHHRRSAHGGLDSQIVAMW